MELSPNSAVCTFDFLKKQFTYYLPHLIIHSYAEEDSDDNIIFEEQSEVFIDFDFKSLVSETQHSSGCEK